MGRTAARSRAGPAPSRGGPTLATPDVRPPRSLSKTCHRLICLSRQLSEVDGVLSLPQVKRLRPRWLTSLAQSPTANREQNGAVHSLSRRVSISVAGLWPSCSLDISAPAKCPEASLSKRPCLRWPQPPDRRPQEDSHPRTNLSFHPSSTDPAAAPFSAASVPLQATGSSCLDNHKSLQTTLPTGSLPPTVHSQTQQPERAFKNRIAS